MSSFLPAPIVGFISGLLFFINIIVAALLIILLGLIKFIVPFRVVKEFITAFQEGVTSLWVNVNNGIIKVAGHTQWEIQGSGKLNFDHWYFIFANHQSWADIIVMQKIFNRKIRLLKFFLKQELLWTLPLGGLACWMLGYPFMKRYSKTYLKKHPEKKNADLETTRAACQIFKQRPTTVMNFLEGTRFTKQKQQDRSSPYKNLLRPKAGGIAFVVTELRNYIKEVIDVTIVYCHEDPSFWNFLCGKIPKIFVHYEVIPIPEDLFGDYYNDSEFRRHFQAWLNNRWQKKDKVIESVLCSDVIYENSNSYRHT